MLQRKEVIIFDLITISLHFNTIFASYIFPIIILFVFNIFYYTLKIKNLILKVLFKNLISFKLSFQEYLILISVILMILIVCQEFMINLFL